MPLQKKILCVFAVLLLFSSCYNAKPVEMLPNAKKVKRTLFIALDGIDYQMVKELKDEGHFKSFQDPRPMISTFPSATTIGFTGIFQPLNVGRVPGYESRFYSFKANKIIGGTPFDVYKIPIHYKYYFDAFRYTMEEKAVMYTFPSMASKQDLVNTKKIVMSSNKNIMMTYLGGTDGSAHMLGRKRTRQTMIFMDQFLESMQRRYQKEHGHPLRIVLFSDHGFQYSRLKHVSNKEIKDKLGAKGFRVKSKIETDQDVVLVKFGLLSSGVGFVAKENRKTVANAMRTVEGIDLVFWHNGDNKKIYVQNHDGATAYFEYKYSGTKKYRYVSVSGDPLHYLPTLAAQGLDPNSWISDKTWEQTTFDHEYPDVGYRLYESFHGLVQNEAGILFSLKPNFQFGPAVTYIGTLTRLGQHGTHGGMFRQTSWAFAMTNQDDNPNPPKFFRYDDFFKYYLPEVTQAYSKGKKKGQVAINPDFILSHDHDLKEPDMKTELRDLENAILAP